MNDCIRYQEKFHDWVDQELDLPTSEEIHFICPSEILNALMPPRASST